MDCSQAEFEKRNVDVLGTGYPTLSGREVISLARVAWRRACFVTHDAVGLASGGYTSIAFHPVIAQDERIIPDGWNHEHCEICQIHIDDDVAHGEEGPGGWTDERAFHWVCNDCRGCLRAWLEKFPIPADWNASSG